MSALCEVAHLISNNYCHLIQKAQTLTICWSKLLPEYACNFLNGTCFPPLRQAGRGVCSVWIYAVPYTFCESVASGEMPYIAVIIVYILWVKLTDINVNVCFCAGDFRNQVNCLLTCHIHLLIKRILPFNEGDILADELQVIHKLRAGLTPGAKRASQKR